MASNLNPATIDPSKPTRGNPSTASVRANFAAIQALLVIAKTEIEALQAANGDIDLSGYAPLDSPVFTGTPGGPTPEPGANDTRFATTAFVALAVAAVLDSAPELLNTINELAAALGDDANYATTITNLLAQKAPLLNALLQSPCLQAYTEKRGTYTLASGTLTLNCASGSRFNVLLTENVTEVVLDNLPDTTSVIYPISLKFTQDGTGGRTVGGWPAGSKGPGGIGTLPAVTAATGGVDYFVGDVDGGVLSVGRAWADVK